MRPDVAAATSPTRTFPVFQPVAEHALLVEFGDKVDRGIHAKVVQLDKALLAGPFQGFIEAVPANAAILVCFDPETCDHVAAEREVRSLLDSSDPESAQTRKQEITVCYDAELAPDLAEVAHRLKCTPEEVIAAHLAGNYEVFMYGFAPGYAYLAGVPDAIHLPRKTVAVRGVAAGSVLIAGPQCLITTLTMPTGWWVIGRSPARILPEKSGESFLFDVGDGVSFRRIARDEFDRMIAK